MIFRYFVAILALFSVPLMTAGQSDEFPLSNDTSNIDLEPNDVETQNGIDLSDWIESTFKGVSDNPVREHANKPIIRLASAPESIMERRPWRSIDDSERAGVFPFQPVSLNPLRRTKPVQESSTIWLTSGGQQCWPLDHGAPTLNDDEVETYFATKCEHSDERDYYWKLKIQLKKGSHLRAQGEWTLWGNPQEFLQSDTTISSACESGFWKSHVKLTYRLDARWSRWRTIYNNSRYATINCQ